MTANELDEARRELDLWSEWGLKAKFWVRDDDACEVSEPLTRLLALACKYDIRIGVAVIPGKMNQSLSDYLNGETRNFHPMCHGWKHINHGSLDKPAEFGLDRPLVQLVQDVEAARKVFVRHFCTSQSIFVPPFNRISKSLIRFLPEIGFAAVSAFPSPLERKLLGIRARVGWVPSIRLSRLSVIPRIDVHIDLIDWRSRTAKENRLVAREFAHQLRARRMAGPAARSPIGLLTHHLVHDARIWRLFEELLDMLRRHDAVEFTDVEDWLKQHTATARSGRMEAS